MGSEEAARAEPRALSAATFGLEEGGGPEGAGDGRRGPEERRSEPPCIKARPPKWF